MAFYETFCNFEGQMLEAQIWELIHSGSDCTRHEMRLKKASIMESKRALACEFEGQMPTEN